MYTERRSRNRIVLVVVLVLLIEPRHPIEDEDENEDDEEKFARRANILRDSSTGILPAGAGWKPALPDRRDACPTGRSMEKSKEEVVVREPKQRKHAKETI